MALNCKCDAFMYVCVFYRFRVAAIDCNIQMPYRDTLNW